MVRVYWTLFQKSFLSEEWREIILNFLLFLLKFCMVHFKIPWNLFLGVVWGRDILLFCLWWVFFFSSLSYSVCVDLASTWIRSISSLSNLSYWFILWTINTLKIRCAHLTSASLPPWFSPAVPWLCLAFYFHMHFRKDLSSSMKHSVEVFIGLVLNLWILLGRTEIVMILTVLIHEHGIFKTYLDFSYFPI